MRVALGRRSASRMCPLPQAGVGHLGHAPLDGHIRAAGHWTTHVVRGAIYDLNYDLLKDFVLVAPRPDVPVVLELAS
jgi:hypothetical protein